MTPDLQAQFDRAQRIVFLTGAGVSTASGIPDYRSKNGLYTNHQNAEYYLSHQFMATQPADFYQYLKDNLYFPAAQPNVIHQRQAALTRQHRATIITQNIDDLYQKAGATNLIPFHGSLYRVYCESCGQTVDWHDYLRNPRHATDQGWLRPDIVLYDEGLDPDIIQAAVAAMQAADLVVIVGTSMRVYPFAGLLDYRNPQAPVLAINQEALSLPLPMQMIQTDATAFFSVLAVPGDAS